MPIATERQKLLRLYLSRYRKSTTSKSSGFTLTELLVVVLLGGLILAGLMKIVVDLVASDFREFARTETQREMAQALRFIASDLQQAIFVYDNLPGIQATNPPPPASAVANLQNIPNGTVLAFWVLEDLPYSGQNLPNNCASFGSRQQECNALVVRRTAYTFVVYTLEQRAGVFEGPAQVVRYELRQYDNLASLALSPDYRDPTEAGAGGFAAWPGPNGVTYAAQANGRVLTDFVDADNVPDFVDLTAQADSHCPDEPDTPEGDYRLIAPNNFGGVIPTSFYACVRIPRNQAGNRDTGSVQDITLYLRGNALGRANLPDSNDPNRRTYLPTLETQVQIRSVFQRDPTLVQ